MPKSLLLVDDHLPDLALLEALLLPLGHKLVTANSGEAALALLATETFDLVLLDLVMPGLDGIDVLTRLRGREAEAHLPVIVITAHSERDYRLRGVEAGADEFLEKPIDRPILLGRVKTLLQLKESQDELTSSRDMLAHRNAVLERLSRQQRDLTQFIVHDLKNPLAVIAGNLHWACENVSAPDRKELEEALGEATVATARMQAMIEELLLIARLEDATLPLHHELVSFDDLLRPVLEPYVRKARHQGVSLLTPVKTACSVRADPAILRRVLENLLDNSLRYTPSAGRVGIAARAADVVEISVSNTGPAIPLAERERIFEKFVRGDSEETAPANAGLGLYFCKCAIEAHGGRIGVFETPEWPTRFLIELPLPA